jgi:AcrR family transcriptional regulator
MASVTLLRVREQLDVGQMRTIRACAALFAERGFLGASVSDLMETAGLTKNAFYAQFPNKDALAAATAEYTAAQWPPVIAQFEALKAPALDTVIALSFEVAEKYASEVVVRAGIRLSLERDAIKTPVPAPLEGWVDEVERLLSPAGEWELMGLACPADVAARVVVTCLIGALQLASGGEVDVTKRLVEVWTVILPGLRPTPDLAARIATAQGLRDRARVQAAATAPTTLYRAIG